MIVRGIRFSLVDSFFFPYISWFFFLVEDLKVPIPYFSFIVLVEDLKKLRGDYWVFKFMVFLFIFKGRLLIFVLLKTMNLSQHSNFPFLYFIEIIISFF